MSMVDVSEKPEIFRIATATGTIKLQPKTIRLIEEGKIAKGDPRHAAKIAGILAAKKTSELIPLCHPLPLTNVRSRRQTRKKEHDESHGKSEGKSQNRGRNGSSVRNRRSSSHGVGHG